MKKVCCILLAILVCFGMFGCQNDQDNPTTTLTPLTSDEFETVTLDEKNHITGEIVQKLLPDALVLKPDRSEMVDAWGEKVYVITDDIDKWCIGDEISVYFSTVERPYDTELCVRIVADWLYLAANDMDAKPIIYFYPETPTVCSAKVTLNGELTCTYPEHGAEGWKDFTAYPDSTLIFPDGKEYYALYWEGRQSADWDFSTGFCVRGEDTAEFLEWALEKQGLTRREANEFIVYWLPLMQENPYNVISFQTTAYTDGASLDITPTPDCLLRVFMAYYPTDAEVEIEPQTFAGFTRQGFTVVEWGGSRVTKL